MIISSNPQYHPSRRNTHSMGRCRSKGASAKEFSIVANCEIRYRCHGDDVLFLFFLYFSRYYVDWRNTSFYECSQGDDVVAVSAEILVLWLCAPITLRCLIDGPLWEMAFLDEHLIRYVFYIKDDYGLFYISFFLNDFIPRWMVVSSLGRQLLASLPLP